MSEFDHPILQQIRLAQSLMRKQPPRPDVFLFTFEVKQKIKEHIQDQQNDQGIPPPKDPHKTDALLTLRGIPFESFETMDEVKARSRQLLADGKHPQTLT